MSIRRLTPGSDVRQVPGVFLADTYHDGNVSMTGNGFMMKNVSKVYVVRLGHGSVPTKYSFKNVS